MTSGEWAADCEQCPPGRQRRTTCSSTRPHSRLRDEKTLTTTFKELGALAEIVEALDRVDITEPFPIQEMAVPIALTGTDLIAQARTGTGKTLAFGVPLLQRITSPHDRDYADAVPAGKPQALVVTPTRELTVQVAEDLSKAGTVREIRILTVYGGVAYEPQLETLESGVDVVVGTPGRLLDLAKRHALDLSHVKVLVLDEADRMLDLGFLPDVEQLLELTHELRQTMLFSATMPGDVVQLARRHMRHPINVRAESAEEGQTVPATAQFVYRTHDLDKPEVLARILQAEDRGRVIVFCTTKRQAQRVADDLAERGFSVAAIHGDLGQVQREKALDRFRAGKIDVLVATDVAARGIDVEAVTHVINYTCPDDEKTYVHRIGRTGRAGASGVAVTFVDWPDTARWKTINKVLELPFDEPSETYSTSDHLYSDIGIPKEVTGRVGKPSAGDTPGDARRGGRSKSRDRGRHDGTQAPDTERPAGTERTKRRTRTRRRLRGGVPVEGDPATATPEATDQSTPGQSTPSQSTPGQSTPGSTTDQSTPDQSPSGDAAADEPVPDGGQPDDGSSGKPRRRRRRTRRRGSGTSATGPSETSSE